MPVIKHPLYTNVIFNPFKAVHTCCANRIVIAQAPCGTEAQTNAITLQITFMRTDKYISFVAQAAKKLRTALFMDCSQSDYPFLSNVVTLLHADDAGNFFFAVRKPFQDISALAQPFYAQLHFFNKQLCFNLTVEGPAHIVGNERAERLCGWWGAAYNPDTDIMLRLRMQKAGYAVRQKKQKRRFSSFFQSMTRWFFAERINPGHNLSISIE